MVGPLTAERVVPAGVAAGAAAAIGAPLGWLVLAAAKGGAGIPRPPVELFATSSALAAASTALALAVAVPLGLLYGTVAVPARRWLLAAHALPAFLPPLLLGLGWFHALPGLRAGLFTPVGLVVVLGLSLAPLGTLALATAAQALDATAVDAALLVATPRRVAIRVVLPGLRRPIASVAVLLFALALSELGLAAFLRVRTWSAVVFQRLAGFDASAWEAALLALPLVAVGAMLAVLERRLGGWDVLAIGALRPAAPFRTTPVSTALAVAGAVLPSVPLAGLAWRAGVAGVVAAIPWAGGSWARSLAYAGAAGLVALGVGVVAGHALARGRGAGRLADGAAAVAFLVPAPVLAAGLAGLAGDLAPTLLRGAPVLVAALAIRYAGVTVRLFGGAVARVPASAEDAARLAHAGYVARLVGVVLPMARGGAIGAAALVVVLALRDLELAAMLSPPGGDTLLLALFTLEANGPEAVVAGLALLQVAVTLAPLSLVLALAERTP